MRESQYQRKLIKKLKVMFPGCIVMKNDPSFLQGIPDLLILFEDKWAMLEIKLFDDSPVQPNQKHYIGLLDELSFASFINPQNEEEVLSDLQRAFGSVRKARLSKSK